MRADDRDPSVSSRLAAARADAAWLAGLAAATLLLHLAVLSAYGWFRDELYYAASSEHLAFGYVGFPPLVALIARCTRALLGDSLAALRLPTVLSGCAVVFLTGWLARELGGGRPAQILAALCSIVSPLYLFAFHVYSMNSFDILFWTLGALVAARILASGDGGGDGGGDGRLWLLFGAVFGLGLENQHSFLLFGFGLAVGLLLTPQRTWFRSRWIWLGGLIACVLILPNLLWEHQYGWPTWDYLLSSPEVRGAPQSFLLFFVQQAFQMHPLTFPVWLAGLLWLLLARHGHYRPLGWIYVVLFAALVALRLHIFYLAPVYPLLFAAGGVAAEGWMRRVPPAARGSRWLRPAVLASFGGLLVIGGALTAPFTLPLLPVESYLRFARAGRLRTTSRLKRPLGTLPQHFADMHGWQEMVAEVARVDRTLPAAEQRVAGVLTQNCGEAAAVDVFGPALGLPKAVSGHDSYFLWGPRGYGEVLLIVGGDESTYRRDCRSLERAGTIHCGLCMPYENEQPVWICRGIDLAAVWPRLKRFQ